MDRVVVEVGRVTLLSPKLTLAYDDQTAPAKDHGLQADLSPAVSSNVDQQALDSLPSSTSQWSGLAGLSAGTAPGPSGDDALSFRGLSPLMNSITIDGTDHNLAFSGRQRGRRRLWILHDAVGHPRIPGQHLELLGGIRPCRWRCHQHRHSKREQSSARRGILLRSECRVGSGECLYYSHRAELAGRIRECPLQTGRRSQAVGRVGWRSDSPEQALLVLRLRSAPARLSRCGSRESA